MKADKPGIYEDFTRRQYLDDCVAGGSCNRTLANVIINESLLHARHRMNNEPAPGTKEMDFGGCAHAVLTGHLAEVDVVEKPNWKSKPAITLRDTAHRLGRFPVLRHDYDRAIDMYDVLTEGVDKLEDERLNMAFRGGQHGLLEPVIVFMVKIGFTEMMCRAMLDWLKKDCSVVIDYKVFTGRGVLTEKHCLWQIEDGLDMQAGFYEMAIESVTGNRPKFYFIFQESRQPFDFRIVSPSPNHLAIGRKKVDMALTNLRTAREFDKWPGYDKSGDFIPCTKGYEERWLGREIDHAEHYTPEPDQAVTGTPGGLHPLQAG